MKHRAAHATTRPRQARGMSDPGIGPRLLEALQHVGNLQRFQLNSGIERMPADPRRSLQVRKDLHMVQMVRLMDGRDDRSGRRRDRAGGLRIAAASRRHLPGSCRRSKWLPD